MMSEPTRLLDDPAIAEGLRADLAQAQSVVLEGLDVSAGAASLNAAIAAETTAAAGTAGAGAGKMVAIGLAGAVTAGALVWFAVRAPEPEPKLVAAPVVADMAEASPPSPASNPPEPEVEVLPKSAEPTSAVVPSLPDPVAPSVSEPEVPALEAAHSTRKQPRKGDKQADYLREARLISDARAALKTDASGALELLAEARSEFPRGLLREEREALTILSFAKLGRSTQARASAKRFLEKHGESPYAAAVRQVLD